MVWHPVPAPQPFSSPHCLAFWFLLSLPVFLLHSSLGGRPEVQNSTFSLSLSFSASRGGPTTVYQVSLWRWARVFWNIAQMIFLKRWSSTSMWALGTEPGSSKRPQDLLTISQVSRAQTISTSCHYTVQHCFSKLTLSLLTNSFLNCQGTILEWSGSCWHVQSQPRCPA